VTDDVFLIKQKSLKKMELILGAGVVVTGLVFAGVGYKFITGTVLSQTK
jgi:hypothetical protein